MQLTIAELNGIGRKVMPKSLVNGIGVSDLPYSVTRYEIVNGKVKLIWACPFYSAWKGMINRCYSEKCQKRQPTYIGCSVSESWYSASRFKEWMEKQDWEGMQLDKDILVEGNKIYSPDACVFVSQEVNKFLTDKSRCRGDLPIGVSFNKENGKFRSNCSNPFTKKQEHLGYFTCPQEAHQAWRDRKHELAVMLANSEFVTDERVAKALINRYRGVI